MIPFKKETLFVPAALFVLFAAAFLFRPVLPVDETRYMSVAWEMWLRGDWLAPLTVNFELYHHKPPMLFWLINASWSVFGVSRWAGLIPVFAASVCFVFLTRALAVKVFKGQAFDGLPYVVLGSVPFVIYSTLVMFDIMLSVFVMLSLLSLLSFAEERKARYVFLMALSLGLGVLTKGPVAWLYVIFPVLLAPYWMSGRPGGWWSWYGGCGAAFVLSVIPVLMWLVPVLKASDPDFAFSLIWEQTAGRVTGQMESAHDRPFYFYLPFLPLMFLPWIVLPSFWRGMGHVKAAFLESAGLRFLACWMVPVFLAFSLIGGKQPHYLVPILPGALILTAYMMKQKIHTAVLVSVLVLAIGVGGQAVAKVTVFQKYDLGPIADYVSDYADRDWAFVRKYQGELTFLGRLTIPIDSLDRAHLKSWFKAHPGGMAVIRFRKPEEVRDYNMIMSMPYRGKNLGVFSARSSH